MSEPPLTMLWHIEVSSRLLAQTSTNQRVLVTAAGLRQLEDELEETICHRTCQLFGDDRIGEVHGLPVFLVDDSVTGGCPLKVQALTKGLPADHGLPPQAVQ